MSEEPRYVDTEDEYDPEFSSRVPKWRISSTDAQRRLLQALGMKYWPLWSRDYRHRFIVVEKGMAPVSTIIPEWPTEWFDHCVSWVERSRKNKKYVSLAGFFTLFFDTDARESFRAGLVSNKRESSEEKYK